MLEIKYILSTDLLEINYKCNKISIKDVIKEIDYKEVYMYIKYLENQEVKGLNLYDFYLYKDISIYNCEIRSILFYRIKHLLYCLKIIEYGQKMIDTVSEDMMIITDSSFMEMVSKSIFNLKCDKIEPYKKQLKNEEIKVERDIRLKNGRKNYKAFIEKMNNKENVLFFSSPTYLNYIKIREKTHLYNTQLGKVLDYYLEESNVMYLDDNNEIALDKCVKYKNPTIPFEIFIEYIHKNSEDIKLDSKLATNNIQLIKKLSFKYNNYDLKYVFLNYILKDIEILCIKCVKNIVSTMGFLQKHFINKIITTDEVFYYQRILVIAGNLLNIKTYGIMHGLIGNYHIEYLINSKYSGKLIPFRTFVWGDIHKNILLENSNLYNNNNIKVVGQIRTDLFSYYHTQLKSYKSESVKILYITDYLEEFVRRTTEILFVTLNKLKIDYEIVIKQHPADKYKDYYLEMIKKYNIKNVSIYKDEDLYELINWSDVVISSHSSVNMEALIFEKISIYLDDLCNDLNEEKNIIAINNPKELDDILSNIQYYKENFKDKFNRYIKDNFYKIDGKVCERIITIIKKDEEIK